MVFLAHDYGSDEINIINWNFNSRKAPARVLSSRSISSSNDVWTHIAVTK